ncbi:MAG TPA: hypothetical protein VJ325_05185 [Thiobacillus sp.]|nr:hypothetical protein [Thiobacillus sp.]
MTEYLSDSALDRLETLARVAIDPVITCRLPGDELLALVMEIRERRRIQMVQDAFNKEMGEKSLAFIKEQLAARGEKWEDQ